jgi:hypothetical protein
MDEKESLRQRIPNATSADLSLVHSKIEVTASNRPALLFVNSAPPFLIPG